MKKKIIIITIILALLFTITINAAPGDNSDPIVVLSYLNQRINELISKYKLEETNTSIEELKTKNEALTNRIETQENTIIELNTKLNNLSTGGNTLVIVNLKANEKLIVGAGTEIILRAGEATAITSELGGLSDVTEGIDIKEGQPITRNHHLIIPRDDGRGVLATTDAIFMVRGAYNVVSDQTSLIDNTEETNPDDDGANPGDDGTNPDDDGTNPDGESTNPDDDGTNPDGESTNPDNGN